MKAFVKKSERGFTLLEYIVALVIAAIVAAMVYTYFGQAITKSSDPIFRFQKASNLRQVMENIVSDYNRLNKLNLRYIWKASTVYPVNSIVTPTTENGYYYRATAISGTGTSGSSEPTWTTTIGVAMPPDGGVTWTPIGKAWKASTAYSLNDMIVPSNANNNGHYYKATTVNGAGTSGTAEPPWPTTVPTPAATVIDYQIIWTEAGTILRSSDVADNLSSYLIGSQGRYGTGYTVDRPTSGNASFIAFDPSTGQDNGTVTEWNILKVTIRSSDPIDSAETITEIFTIR
jgi:prepilin-type N-terminal cleavage/methylation domain-containing protein